MLIALKLLGSIALLMYGMKVMSEALQKMAGPQLRHMLGAMTTNRFTGVATGALVTVAVQSSAATKNSEIEENSYLKIDSIPKQTKDFLNGLFSGYIEGFFIVLTNDSGWEIITINYSDENAEKLLSPWNKLFPQ